MTSLLTVKLRRDLRATWPRILMMVVAVAVSLTVFSAVLYTWSTIDRETARAYLSTEPASATILLDRAIDAEEIAVIAAETRARPGVLDATGRSQFTGRVQGEDGRWRTNPMQVFVAAPDDPMRMAKFDARQDSWPPAAGDIQVGGDTLTTLDIAVGETVLVETPSGEAARLRVAGTVYDPSLAPTAQEQTGHGYLSTASLAEAGDQPGEPAALNQLKIQVADQPGQAEPGEAEPGEAEPGQAVPSRDRDAIVAVVEDIGEWLRVEQGLVVREIQVPEPYQHPHQGQADALLSALLIGGGAALLLSTILVANMLSGLFTQQIPQIGIMKAIGARSGRIGRLYLAMTLAVAGAATLLALGPGILISRAFVPNVLGFLAIAAVSVAAPWWTYLVVLAAGLTLPPLMALIPLVRTSRTTVRAAIDHRGLGSSTRAATWVITLFGRIRGLNRALLMALRNTTRRPARTLLSVALLASAGMLFVAGMSARAGMEAVAEDMTDQLRWDVVVRLASPTPVNELTMVERMPQVSRVEGWTVTQSGVAGPGQIPVTRTYPDQGHGRLTVTAIPADTTMLTPPELREGRWLEPQESGAIVLNQITLANNDLDVRPGDTVQLSVDGQPTNWRVAGIAAERGASSAAYVTAEGLAEATGQPPRVNTLRITTDSHDEQTRAAVATAVDTILTGASIEVRSAESVSRQEASTEGHLAPILVILLATALPMGIIGCIGLASTMGANVLERIREFGVMHAIGARPAAVRRIVVAEGVFIALASCVLAVIPAIGLTMAMDAVLGNAFLNAPLPFRISLAGAGIWTALVILGAALATEAAATRASHLTVREALAYL